MTIEKLIVCLLIGAMGYLFLWVGVTRWRDRYSCKVIVNGKCLKKETFIHGHSVKERVLFEYDYAGERRRHFALENLAGRKERQFKEGEIYTLYVNPKKPGIFRCTKKVFSWMDFITFLAGSIFIGSALVLLFQR